MESQAVNGEMHSKEAAVGAHSTHSPETALSMSALQYGQARVDSPMQALTFSGQPMALRGVVGRA